MRVSMFQLSVFSKSDGVVFEVFEGSARRFLFPLPQGCREVAGNEDGKRLSMNRSSRVVN
jgi:hypothetical protein